MTESARRWVGLGGLVATVIFSALAVFSLIQLLLGLADTFRRRTLDGSLIRRREFGGGDDSEPSRYLAVDDGSDDDVLAFKVRSQIYHQASQGSRVRIEYSPWLGYVKSLTVLEAAPEIAYEAMALSSIESALISVTNRFSEAAMTAAGGIQLQALHNAKAPDGTPMLDQIGPDGRTLRETLSANHAQIAQLQSDPRVANSPVRGFLDALVSGGGLPPPPPPPPPPPGGMRV